MTEAVEGDYIKMPVTVEIRLGQLLADCAAQVYNQPSPVPRIIDQTISWTIGDLHIMANIRSNELYVAGELWDVNFNSATGKLLFGGKIEGNLHSGKMLVGQQELLALIVAALRITRHEREGPESNQPSYP